MPRTALRWRTPIVADQSADEQLLGQTHPGIGRHFEAAELDKAEAAGGAIGRKELVDADFRAVGIAGHICEKIAEKAIRQPGQGRAGGDVGPGRR